MRADEKSALRIYLARQICTRRMAFKDRPLMVQLDPFEVMALEAQQDADIFTWCALHPRYDNHRVRHGYLAYVGIDAFSGDM